MNDKSLWFTRPLSHNFGESTKMVTQKLHGKSEVGSRKIPDNT